MFKPMRNPRIFVTLDPELVDAIRVIAARSGKSSSSVIAEMVVPRRDYLLQLASALDSLSRLSQPLSSSLRARLDELEHEASQMERDALAMLDQLTLEIAVEHDDNSWADARAGTKRKRSGSVRSSAEKPPVFNKGVTIRGGDT